LFIQKGFGILDTHRSALLRLSRKSPALKRRLLSEHRKPSLPTIKCEIPWSFSNEFGEFFPQRTTGNVKFDGDWGGRHHDAERF
jgi:hypothetical protein